MPAERASNACTGSVQVHAAGDDRPRASAKMTNGGIDAWHRSHGGSPRAPPGAGLRRMSGVPDRRIWGRGCLERACDSVSRVAGSGQHSSIDSPRASPSHPATMRRWHQDRPASRSAFRSQHSSTGSSPPASSCRSSQVRTGSSVASCDAYRFRYSSSGDRLEPGSRRECAVGAEAGRCSARSEARDRDPARAGVFEERGGLHRVRRPSPNARRRFSTARRRTRTSAPRLRRPSPAPIIVSIVASLVVNRWFGAPPRRLLKRRCSALVPGGQPRPGGGSGSARPNAICS